MGKDWVSISLEYMAIELDPPLKLDSGTMMIDPRVTQRRGQMLNMRHNLEQHQAHACVTVPVLPQGVPRSEQNRGTNERSYGSGSVASQCPYACVAASLVAQKPKDLVPLE